jgi:hypothetical protein
MINKKILKSNIIYIKEKKKFIIKINILIV